LRWEIAEVWLCGSDPRQPSPSSRNWNFCPHEVSLAPLLISSAIFAVVLLLLLARLFWRLYQPRRIVILEHQRGVLYVRGRLTSVLEPGLYWTTLRRQITPVDTRRQLHQMPGQEILTSDGIAVKISASLEYSIVDPQKMLTSSNNFIGLVYSQGQLDLRTAVGELTLESILNAREAISGRFLQLLAPSLTLLGAELHSARVLDIMLPADIRRAYASAVTAQKEGLASLERARGETAALRSLANAARLTQDHPGLLQLRALQTLDTTKGSATLELRFGSPANSSHADQPSSGK
jgi:regulator of protease activity HflC (stomatin/prohibitin superfamily)